MVVFLFTELSTEGFCIIQSRIFYVIMFERFNYYITILLKHARIYFGKNFFM